MNIIDQTVFHLAATGQLKPAAEALANSRPDRVNDLPAFYYWKDAIVVGSYLHPVKGFALDITRDRLDGFVNNFARMRENGVAVPILADHTPSASSTLGWIVDVKRDEDRLLELHQFLGETARDTGLRNKVSLGIDPNFIDGKGNQYGEAIVHSAITPVPVVPGLGDFVALELSMELSSAPLIDRSKVLAAEAASPVGGSSLLLQLARMKRDLALSRGGVTPAIAGKLFDLLLETPAAIHLSRTDQSQPLLLAVFDLLAANHPVSIGETTGLQVLSRVVPDDDTGPLQQKMIDLASARG